VQICPADRHHKEYKSNTKGNTATQKTATHICFREVKQVLYNHLSFLPLLVGSRLLRSRLLPDLNGLHVGDLAGGGGGLLAFGLVGSNPQNAMLNTKNAFYVLQISNSQKVKATCNAATTENSNHRSDTYFVLPLVGQAFSAGWLSPSWRACWR
jgi:hypothetical protein